MPLGPYLDQTDLAAAWRTGTFAVTAAGRVECAELSVSGAAGVTGDLELDGAVLFGGVRWLHDSGHIANAFAGANAGNLSVTGQFNTGLGYNALLALTSGNYNVAVGAGALDRVTTGGTNVAVGYLAGRGTASNAKAGGVFIGYMAGANEDGSNKLYIHNSDTASPLIYGDFSTAAVKINGTLESTGNFTLGGRMLKDGVNLLHTSGSDSVYVGLAAGNTSSSGSGNIGIGTRAMMSATTADRCIGIGVDALRYLTSGANNVCLGAYAGDAITTASNCTALGYSAVSANQTGANNTGIGYNSLTNTTVGNNTALGFSAAANITTGSGTVAVGVEALSNCQAGTGNVAVGFQAGKGTALHSNGGSVYIGFQAGMSYASANRLYIHNADSAYPLIYGEFNNNMLRVCGDLQLLNPSIDPHILLYYDYTDASNFRRFRIDSRAIADKVILCVEQTGTPTMPDLTIGAGEVLSLAFQSSGTGAGTTAMTVSATGLYPQTDDAMGLGTQNFRFKDVFAHRLCGARSEITAQETPVSGVFTIWQAATAGTHSGTTYAADDILITVSSSTETKTAKLFIFSTGAIG